MQKIGAVLFILLLGLQGFFTTAQLFAQDDNDPSFETDWDEYLEDLYTRGDQTFIISLGTVFPVLFVNQGRVIDHKFTPPVGGTGSLNYNYYLSSNIFWGGELGIMFISTIANSTVFIIPLGTRVGYQFVYKRFEFPLSIGFGMVWHRYLNSGYYGIYTRGGGGAFFRATHNWSFGLSSNWYWYPEWTDNKKYNVHGNIVDTTLSARYHF